MAVLAFGAIALGNVEQIHSADVPPELMTYQGYLVDGNGKPLGSVVDPLDSTQRVSAPANYDVVFRIYNEKSGSTAAIWAEKQTVTVDKGYFSVLLGEGASTATGEPQGNLSEVFHGSGISDRFIGITVEGLGGAGVDVEIAPRLRFVASPFAFTATQATKLTDSAGNSNFIKVGTSLELGAGSTPTLTLPEAGGATLSGKMTADLPSWGAGLQIDNGSLTTTFGAANASYFHFTTGLPTFYFNTDVNVNGKIRSHGQDTILGPSNNTDTYLQVYDDSSDKIEARADQFVIQGDSYYLRSKFSSNQVDLETNASKFKMNKPLDVNGALSADSMSVDGGVSANNLTIIKPDNAEAVLSAYGSSQGTGRLYVGQSTTHGGGIIYNGDASPAFAGSSEDAISFYRTASSVHHEVFKYKYNSDNVTFNGRIGIGTGSPSLPLHINSSQRYSADIMLMRLTGSGSNWDIGIDDEGGTADDDLTFWYNGVQEGWMDPGSNAWKVPSDKRLKKNIQPYRGGVLDGIENITVYTYNMKNDPDDSPVQLGVMAQDIQNEFPELVSEEDSLLGLDYGRVSILSFSAIKELRAEKDAEIAGLRSDIETLKSEMAVLKARLANSTTQEDRIAKLEELVSKIGQGE